MATDRVSSAFDRYRDALENVPAHARPTVDMLCSQAVAYVWGWQDAGGEVRNTERSTEFGYAYGTVVARYEARWISSYPPIQDAWRSWQEHGEIRDYTTGKTLDGEVKGHG